MGVTEDPLLRNDGDRVPNVIPRELDVRFTCRFDTPWGGNTITIPSTVMANGGESSLQRWRQGAMNDWLYTRGVPDRKLAGMSLRGAFHPYASSPWVLAAAEHLGRDVRHVDMYGFQREMIAATEPTAGRPLAYVESQAREKHTGGIEVYFYLIIRENDGAVRGTELESYNPYFGCEVGYLEWCQDCVILIYREKHRTYVCRVDPKNRTTFVAIRDDWVAEGEVISHRFALDPTVRRLALPSLNDLPPIADRECTE